MKKNVCVCVCVRETERERESVLVTQSRLFATPWTVAHQIPLPIEFSRQEYWSLLHCRQILYHLNHQGSLHIYIYGGASGKEPACQFRRHKRHGLDLWVGKIPWRRAWQPSPVFLPGESQGQRSQAGYSPQHHSRT